MFLGYHKPIYPHPDDAAISMLSEILAGSSISPMYTELVKKRQIAASIGAEEGPGSAYPNLLLFAITPKAPHSNTDVLRAFDSVLKKFLSDGVSEEKLNIAKRAMATEYLGKMKSSISLAIDLASTELINGDWTVILDWFDQVMKVTTADVQRVGKLYLVDRNRVVGRLETAAKENTLKNARM